MSCAVATSFVTVKNHGHHRELTSSLNLCLLQSFHLHKNLLIESINTWTHVPANTDNSVKKNAFYLQLPPTLTPLSPLCRHSLKHHQSLSLAAKSYNKDEAKETYTGETLKSLLIFRDEIRMRETRARTANPATRGATAPWMTVWT